MQKTNLNPPQNHAVNNIPCFKCASNEPLGIQDNISTVLDLKDYKFVSQLPGVSSASTKKSRWTRKSLVSRITLLTGVFGSTTVLEKNELLLLEISYFTWDSTSFRDSAVLYQINIAEIKNQVHQFFWLWFPLL